MSIALVSRELLFATRIAGAAETAGVDLLRVDDPSALPPPSAVTLVLVDWTERGPDWGPKLAAWCSDATESVPPRVILFGPHRDLAAHAAARESGLGPMWARSKLLAELPSLLG